MLGRSATGKQNKLYARKNVHVKPLITLCSQKVFFMSFLICFKKETRHRNMSECGLTVHVCALG
jgi:hypothetical protein